ncbi:MAG: beta-aspartyl-peptidase [Rhodovibrionaceae bacterium]|nr:beta-aspartyl-peptidase [Rhodovibrionaceae bacterium]
MLRLVKASRVYAPEATKATDILIAGERIAAVGDALSVPADWPVEVVEAPDLMAVPGFIDQHVHATGGGGEGGYATRCPEITAETIARRGITAIVGVLGTDSISRSPADLLAKVRALREEGIAAYMYTGAYRVPPPTLTGDIQRDLNWIPEVIGVGEIAISDHRSSQPRQDEIERLVADARVGAMLAGKRGICHFHLGDGTRGLEMLRRLLEETEIPAEQIIPTHVNRRPELLAEAAQYATTFDAAVDVTAFDGEDEDDESTGFNGVKKLLDLGVPSRLITMSSDCNGSLPQFNEAGELVAMGVADNGPFLDDWRRLVLDGVLDMPEALGIISGNVARVLGLSSHKGRLAQGYDADFTLLDADLQPQMTFVGGRCVWQRA